MYYYVSGVFSVFGVYYTTDTYNIFINSRQVLNN